LNVWTIAAQLGKPPVVESGQLDAAERDGSRGRAIEPGEQVHERRLARSRRAMIAAKRPDGNATVTPASASTAASPSP